MNTPSTNPRRSPREEIFESLISYGLTAEEAHAEMAEREETAQRMLNDADPANRAAVAQEARAHLFAKTPMHVMPRNGRATAAPSRPPADGTRTRPADTQPPLRARPRTADDGAPPSRTAPETPPVTLRGPRRTAAPDGSAQVPVRTPPQASAPPEVLEEAGQQETDYSVEAIDLIKVYATDNLEVQALKGVSLAVPRGDMVAIMGPSGCGKTTLLNCLSGLDTVDGGVVRVDGVDLANLSDDAKSTYRARSMGFVFQFYNLLPVLNAVENVELPLLVSGVPAREARERAIRALELVKLGDWANHRPAQLSGGQRQRVTIARALVNGPAIVWADEPTGDLDSKNADEIMDLILGLNRDNGQTFVIVTHDIRVAEKTFRIVNMLDGEIVSETMTETGKARAAAAVAK